MSTAPSVAEEKSVVIPRPVMKDTPLAPAILTVCALAIVFLLTWLLPTPPALRGIANYLPIHITLEGFSIVVAMLVFGITWNAYSSERPGNVIIIACAMLAVGLIDFMHMLSFKGMPELVTPSGPEKAINFWLAARLLAALALLAAAVRPWTPLPTPRRRHALLGAGLAITALVGWVGLFHQDALPRTFVEGKGLTPVKIAAEYLIIVLLIVPVAAFYRASRRGAAYDAAGLFAAATVSLLSELSFTLYKDVSDIFNLLGHVYKVIAYLFIYRALFVASVREPFEMLGQQVAVRKRAEEEAYAASRYARSLIEASLDPLVTINAEGKITDVNDATVNATGVPREELMGTDFSDYFTEPQKASNGYRAVFDKGSVTDYPLTIRGRNGQPTDVLYNASVYRDARGEILGVFAAARDVTERKRAEAAICELNATLEQSVRDRTAQLEAANKELEAFAYSVSHDLRVPLRAVDGFSRMLEKKFHATLGDEGGRLIDVVRQSAQRMGRLIDDILAFSRMGRKAIAQEEIDMGALARAAAEEMESNRAAGNLQLQIDELPRARGDAAMLRQVWVNLLANAFKFTRPKPSARIEVGAREEADENIYFVKDNGVGFDMRYAHKLFGVFQRLHGVDEFEGTGIGLAIVQRIVSRHGGRVWAEGEVDQGATLSFTLPKLEAASIEGSVPAQPATEAV